MTMHKTGTPLPPEYLFVDWTWIAKHNLSKLDGRLDRPCVQREGGGVVA